MSVRAIVRDEPDELRAAIARVCDEDLADAIVTTGGTGIAPRDRTYEAIEALLEKTLDGFGEAFRRLSWDEVGPRSRSSRAPSRACTAGASWRRCPAARRPWCSPSTACSRPSSPTPWRSRGETSMGTERPRL